MTVGDSVLPPFGDGRNVALKAPLFKASGDRRQPTRVLDDLLDSAHEKTLLEFPSDFYEYFSDASERHLVPHAGMYEWANRLNDLMERKGWGATELAKRSGMDRESIYKYQKHEVAQPRGDAIARLAAALGVNALWLKEGVGPEHSTIPVVGYVSAGESMIPFDDNATGQGYDEISFEIEGDPIAIEVRGTSMVPAYRPGDRLICSRRRGVDIDGCIGRDCVVMTENGEGYLKVLRRGSRAGKFTLESYNRAYPELVDVPVRWVAPVIWIRRPN